ncbi:MAG TPA: archaetidylserine decarboxylase [Gammaproteobacteria bacterium]|nr:archaetidylserine decarboxylase [Gammaproteobacteria bacterium]
MSGRLSALAQALIPQKLLGSLVYRLSRSEVGWLKHLLIRGFLRLYPIDLNEAEPKDPRAYPSFNSFFTRGLRDGARPLTGGEDVIVSPCDGRLTEYGNLDGNRLVQAKGRRYTTHALLGESPDLIESFDGGSFATIYLAPQNYHRVHAPIAGRLDRARYIPGRRFSVNSATALHIDNLYCRNERVSLWLSTAVGYSVVVMIGALNVASLTTTLTGEIASGAEKLIADESPRVTGRGDELGRFNLGSTIVMLFPKGTTTWLETLASGQEIRMGQPLGSIVRNAAQ